MKVSSFYPQLLLSILGLLLSLSAVRAQVIPDRTLGSESSVVTPDVIDGIKSDRIDGGAVRGSNLFQSFQEFSVGEGRGAYFANPVGIANIFSRVTGSNISQILGTLGVLGNANLYFLNPNGILFGPNSQLDIKGSFLATTAESFQFANGYAFSAITPDSPPLLTVNIPIGLQFRQNVQKIVNQSQSGLSTERGITLVGGNISLEGGKIISPGSDVSLSSISGNGTVNLQVSDHKIGVSIPENIERGNIILNNGSEINVRGKNGGSITMNANNLNLDGESTRLRVGIAGGSGTVSSQAGDINLNVVNQFSMRGAIISNAVVTNGQGNAGNIIINAGSLSLQKGAGINGTTFGNGKAGSIQINAANFISITGGNSSGNSSFIANEIQSSGIGSSGGIIINTSTLDLKDGGHISSNNFGNGNSGVIQINAAKKIIISGEDSLGLSSYIANQIGGTGVGNSQGIIINTPTLSLENGGNIAASTFGQGNAGQIKIKATDRIKIAGKDSSHHSSYIASEVGDTGIGNSEGIFVNTSRLTLENGGSISAITFGQGNAGSVQINAADSVSISDTYFDQDLNSDIGGVLTFTETQGNAGDIYINTPKLTILKGAGIEAFTQGNGNAGKITIDTGQLQLTDNSQVSASTVNSEAGSILIKANQSVQLNQGSRLSVEATKLGIAGDLRIATNQLVVDGKSKLSVSSPSGQAGNINVQADTITLNQGSITAETGQSGQRDGANINLQVTGLLTLKMANESLISATANGSANGGNITIDSPFLIVKQPQGARGSDIIAKAFFGNGGKIQINALGIFGITEGKALTDNQSNDIDASSEYGAAGIVQINQAIDPNRDLVALPVDVIDPNNLIDQNPCKRGKKSEFTNAGRGGLPPSLMEDFTSSASQASLVNALFPMGNPISPSQDISPEPEMRSNSEPAQGWRLNDKGQMMLIGEPTQATIPQRLSLPIKGCPAGDSAQQNKN